MHRNPAHGNILAQMLAALGQGDVQRLGCLCCIREEHLVEIAHAIEQQIVGMRGLEGQILRHHGCGIASDA